jgi:hypothetical protein
MDDGSRARRRWRPDCACGNRHRSSGIDHPSIITMTARNRGLLLTVLTLAGCATAADPAAGPSSAPAAIPGEPAEGCWTLSIPGSRRGALPPLSVLRLDTAAISARPEDGMRLRMFSPTDRTRRISGRSSWLRVQGGETVQIRVEDELTAIEARVRVQGDALRGQVRGGSGTVPRTSEWMPLSGSRVTCPAELS